MAVLRLPNQSVLVVLVYIEGKNIEALYNTTIKLHQLIQETQNKIGI